MGNYMSNKSKTPETKGYLIASFIVCAAVLLAVIITMAIGWFVEIPLQNKFFWVGALIYLVISVIATALFGYFGLRK